MAENLRTTHYNNGDRIDTTDSVNQYYAYELYPKYQWPVNGDKRNVSIYGRLYTWLTATDNRNICPMGWHLPSQEEWETLVNYLGGNTKAGAKMKEIGTSHWKSPNTGADNTSGFSGLPSGTQIPYGIFVNFQESTCWWSSTPWDDVNICFTVLYYNSGEVFFYNNDRKEGNSIRCIKDN
jgi:uncharacterized protein (TIGR02145 family)